MTYIHRELESTTPTVACSIDRLYSAYSYFYSKDFVFSGEYHEAWELVYVCTGSVVIETPEYKVILSKNQALLHSPNERHKIRANNMCCSLFIFSFDCSCKQLYDIAHKPLSITQQLHNYFISTIEEGLSCLAGKNHIPIRNLPVKFASEQVVKNTLELILISLIRSNLATERMLHLKKGNPSSNHIITLIVDHLKEHIHEKLSLESIADSIGYSISHICSVFQKNMGISIKSYFNKLRIDKAKELIAERNMSLQQISDSLNFYSLQYFSLRFKKETGLTPSQYASFLKSQTYHFDSLE